MKKYLKNLLVLVISAVFILPNISCESGSLSDVNQDRVYTSYSFDYDAGDQQTDANATFKFEGPAGTALILDPPASITLNGEAMNRETIPFAFYTKTFSGFEAEGTFVFTDAEEVVYENTIETANSIDFSIDGAISRTGDFVLEWIGEPIAQHELVRVTLSGENNFTSRSELSVGATSITLSAAQLADLEPGSYAMDISRTYEPPLMDFTEEGGTISSTYTSIKRTVTVQ